MKVLLCSIAWICLTIQARTDSDHVKGIKIKAGIESGNAIINALGSPHFGKIGDIARNIAPFLGAAGPFLSLFLTFTNSPELQYMKREFAKVEANFGKMFNRLDRVENLIMEKGLKAQYAADEKQILHLWNELQNMRTSQGKRQIDTHKRSFLREYKSQQPLFNLWHGMAGSGILSDQIPSTAMKYLDYDRKKVQILMKGVFSLILKGVEIELAYYMLKGDNHTYNARLSAWEQNVIKVVDKMLNYDQKVANEWKDQSGKDLDSKLAQWDGWSQSGFADNLRKFLKDKYYWRDWFVIAYDPIKGSDVHWVKWCGGHHRFRSHGRNVVVASVDENKSYPDLATIRSDLGAVSTKTCHRGAWASPPSCNHHRAKDIYNSLPYKYNSGCTYAAVGVILRKKTSFWGKVSYNQIAYDGNWWRYDIATNGNFRLHAFG